MCNFCNIEVNGSGNFIGQLIWVGDQSIVASKPVNKPMTIDSPESIQNLPDLDREIIITDECYQKYIIVLIRHLLAKGMASVSGRYIRGTATIPVFRDKEKQGLRGLEVLSIDKKTGQRLLNGEYLSRPDTVNKLLCWIVEKFSVVKDMAERAYNTELDRNRQCAHIIVGAAMFIEARERQRESGLQKING